MIDSLRDVRLHHESAMSSESAIIVLRAKLATIARRCGFGDLLLERMVLAASELASNQTKYAHGRGVIQVWQQPGPVIDLFAIDHGPGIADLRQATADGFSTARTLGKGLGSVQRLSGHTCIYSVHRDHSQGWHGTAVLARFHGEHQDGDPDPGQATGIYCRPLANDRFMGDRILLSRHGRQWRWLHLDGLGHGQEAERAVSASVLPFSSGRDRGPRLLERVHERLAEHRGAVAVTGWVDTDRGIAELCGVGDVSARVWGNGPDRNIAFPSGILGRQMPALSEQATPFGPRCGVITTTDGIRRGWEARRFPGLLQRHPQLIAYLLGNIMGRLSDDQSVFVLGPGPAADATAGN